MENSCHIDLTDVLFSWSIDDIFNQELFKDQVEIIPQTFKSVQHYVGSIISPLLEELRTELSLALEAISRAPFADVILLEKSKPNSAITCNVVFEHWRRIPNNHAKQPYEPSPGDILVFIQAKCETVEDLQRSGRTWAFGYILKQTEEAEPGTNVTKYEVKVPNGFKLEDETCKFFYASFLTNIATFKRTWTALDNLKTSEVLDKVLRTDSEVGETCNMCSRKGIHVFEANKQLIYELNESQYKAVASCLCKLECTDRPNLELIWGPPGTGKSRTLAVLLVMLSELKCRTLICAPTYLAIAEVASCLVEMLREFMGKGKDALCCPFSDIILFGNSDGLKVNHDTEEVLLNYRVKKLVECFGSSSSGWRSCFKRMIQFMEDFGSFSEASCDNQQIDSLDSVREFSQLAISLKKSVSTICSHVPSRCISEQFFVMNVQLIELLDSFGACLYQGSGVSTFNEFSLRSEGTGPSKFSADKSTLKYLTTECLCALRALEASLNEVNISKEGSIRDFCLQNASLVLCTASNSYKLQKINVEPFKVLIINKAAQLKECESIVPLQVPNIRHVILIGDDRQLPALVRSKVSEEAMFGRSLFERLSLLGRAKHLLNVQYQMHPLISSFPNTKFYDNCIMDALEVKCKSYRKCYIPGPVFGPLSFINISAGKEVRDEQGSWKNLVEVAVASKIVQLLHRACIASKGKTSVGIVAPYSAQITELRRKIGRKYENFDNFRVEINGMDECRGSKDVVIMSTVRCSNIESFDILCDPQRINMSMTRARHCLWVLGDERTLRKKRIWDEFISDSKARMCYFSADENKDIESVIWNVKKELDQLDDFLVGDSMLFKTSTWKVLFSDNFKKSFAKLKSVEMKNLVLFLLTKLSSGWRPKRSLVNISCERSSEILKTYMVKEVFLVCSVEVEIVEDVWSQVFKV